MADEEELDRDEAPAEDRLELDEPDDVIDDELGEHDGWIDRDDPLGEPDDDEPDDDDEADLAAMAELDALDIDWDEPVGAPSPHLTIDPDPDPPNEDEVAA
jgi:hypothetical protein